MSQSARIRRMRKRNRDQSWVAGPVHRGFVFDTDFETGCVAQSTPQGDGNFDGLDSEGVEVSFHVSMVKGHPQYEDVEGE